MTVELTYFPVTGYWFDVEAPLSSGSSNVPQFLVVSAFVTFTARVPVGWTAQIANLDIGGGTPGDVSLAIPPITGRIVDGQLVTINASDTPNVELLANSTPISTALTASGISSLIYDVSFTQVVYAGEPEVLQNFGFTAPTDTTSTCITDPALVRLPYVA